MPINTQTNQQCQVCFTLHVETVIVEDGALRVCEACAENLHTCGRCGEDFRLANVLQTMQRGLFCNNCYTLRFACCNDCGCEINRQADAYSSDSAGLRCRSCNTTQGTPCEHCGEHFPDIELVYNPRDQRVCQVCYDESIANCHNCGGTRMRREMHRRGDRRFCGECYNSSQWEHSGFHVPQPTYQIVGSQRKFGIELETHACPNHDRLRNNTAFGCKEEGSVDGLEFVSPVFYSDSGFEEVDKICAFARENNWELNSSCGFHIHCDMSSESNSSLNAVAIAYHYTYDMWLAFFSDSRKRNYYCAQHDWDANDVLSSDSFEDFASMYGQERYRWLNVDSYRRFRTFEIRLHSGTLNATKIKNWTKAHLKFIDIMSSMSIQDITDNLANVTVAEQFEFISNLWDDSDLTEWLRGRAEHFNHPLTVITNEELAI